MKVIRITWAGRSPGYGKEQLTRYLGDEQRRVYLSRFELHAAIALFIDGDELVWEPFVV